MRAVVTAVNEAAVTIDGRTVGSIGRGFLVLLGVAPEDTEAQAKRLRIRSADCVFLRMRPGR